MAKIRRKFYNRSNFEFILKELGDWAVEYPNPNRPLSRVHLEQLYECIEENLQWRKSDKFRSFRSRLIESIENQNTVSYQLAYSTILSTLSNNLTLG